MNETPGTRTRGAVKIVRGSAMLVCALVAACTTDGAGGGSSSSAGATTGAGGSGSTTSTAGSTGTTTGSGSTAGSTSSTSGAGGSGSTTSTAGATGGAATGGAGPTCATTCTTPSDCPAPASECVQRTCDMGCCGTLTEPEGKVTAGGQAAHDCRVVVCDGAGSTKSIPLDTDLLDDGNACTIDACLAGSPSNLPAPAGAACSAGGKLCDGNGACVECLTTADCTGTHVCDPLGGTRTCVAATCADTVKSGFETDVDCGGPKCAPCADGKLCLVATDCASNVCSGGLCLPPVCGDGIESPGEGCDDRNEADGDGCSSTCSVELGFTCTGTPSTCTTTCRDGIKASTEGCDDGNSIENDGCSSTCTVEVGYACTGSAPSVCKTICGDGIRAGNEACDDGNVAANDGCSPTCTVEPRYACTGSAPSVCKPICGDGFRAGNETCDDHNTLDGDGCTAKCMVEPGYTCIGTPSFCKALCGDGIKTGSEPCDDGNTTQGDGCSPTCNTEAGFTCTGTPSVCTTTCGDGVRAGSEACDDGNLVANDGCSPTCTVEARYTCTGSAPSVCKPICGDGFKTGKEPCDDGNTTSGDGCSSACTVEPWYSCTGAPSVCTPVSCADTVSDVSNCGTCGHVCVGFWPLCVGGVCTSGAQFYPSPPTGQHWTDCSSGPTTQNGGDLLWVTRTSISPSFSFSEPPYLGFGSAGEVAVALNSYSIGSQSFPSLSLDGFLAPLRGAYPSISSGGDSFPYPAPGAPRMPSCGNPCVGTSSTVVSTVLNAKYGWSRARLVTTYQGGYTQLDGMMPLDPGMPLPFQGVNVDLVGNTFVVFANTGSDVRLLRINASGTSHLPGFTGVYAPDRTGGVLRFGLLSAGQDVGCGPMTPGGPWSYYLARLDGSWDCVYGKVLAGYSWLGADASLQADANGGAILTTTTTAAIDLGCGPIQPPAGSTTLTRLDPSGNCIFSRMIGAPSLSTIPSVNETLLFGAAPAGSVDLGGGPLAPIDSSDLLLVKLDASGNHLWSKRIWHGGGAKVSISTAGNIYLMARYAGVFDFGGGLITSGPNDVVVASYSPAGVYRWSRRYTFNTQHVAGIDACGSLVVAAANRNFDAGNGPVLAPFMLAPDQNVAVVRYAP